MPPRSASRRLLLAQSRDLGAQAGERGGVDRDGLLSGRLEPGRAPGEQRERRLPAGITCAQGPERARQPGIVGLRAARAERNATAAAGGHDRLMELGRDQQDGGPRGPQLEHTPGGRQHSTRIAGQRWPRDDQAVLLEGVVEQAQARGHHHVVQTGRPEAERDGGVAGPHLVPPERGDVQQVARAQGALEGDGRLQIGESIEVGRQGIGAADVRVAMTQAAKGGRQRGRQPGTTRGAAAGYLRAWRSARRAAWLTASTATAARAATRPTSKTRAFGDSHNGTCAPSSAQGAVN
jgi:hypothetical protein